MHVACTALYMKKISMRKSLIVGRTSFYVTKEKNEDMKKKKSSICFYDASISANCEVCVFEM